jgi:nucleoside-diphosphate-sugar epimerase
VAARLARDGLAVRCLTRPSSDTALLAGLDVETVVGDLTDPESLARAAAGCHYLVHCAGLVSDWATRAEIAAVNVLGTQALLDACLAAGVQRVVHLSTTDVYCHPGMPAVSECHAPTRFANWYAHTKREAEARVRAAQATGTVDTVILRPATVYGPGSRDVVGEIARAITGGHMLLIDGGRRNAGLCYVDNLVDAIVLALGHPAAVGEQFNVTDGLTVTWRRFTDDLANGLGAGRVRWSIPYRPAHLLGFVLEHGYRMLRSATGIATAPLLSRQAVEVLGRDQDFSNARLRRLLGWEPLVDYEAGLAATVSWLVHDHLAAT